MITKTARRTVDELEQSGLRMYRFGLTRVRGVAYPIATAATAKGTPIQLRVRMIAEMVGQTFAAVIAVDDAQMSDTAVGEDLDRLCGLKGITRSAGSGATGAVLVTTSSAVTFLADAELTCVKNGKRYRVVSTTIASSGERVGIVGKDTGRATNLPAGEVLKWVSPPGGSSPTCIVSPEGLTDGQDADTDARLRTRLQKTEKNPSGAGNWAQVVRWAEESSASVEDAYAYPAVHGPGTMQCAVTIEGTAANRYARAASDALVAIVTDAILGQYPNPANATVSTVAHEPVSLAVRLSLADPTSAGGDGGGWLDAVRWPLPFTNGGVVVTNVVTASVFQVNATTAPSVGKHLALWDAADFVFQHAVITGFSGSPGNYTLTLDRALPSIAVGAYVCPDAERLDDYARVLCEQVALLGPGQRTVTAGRARRHPDVSPERPSQVSTLQLARLQDAFAEVSSATMIAVNGSAYVAPVAPTQATGLDQKPNIHRVGQIGFYA